MLRLDDLCEENQPEERAQKTSVSTRKLLEDLTQGSQTEEKAIMSPYIRYFTICSINTRASLHRRRQIHEPSIWRWGSTPREREAEPSGGRDVDQSRNGRSAARPDVLPETCASIHR